MSSLSFRRSVIALVLGMTLVSSLASASELRSRPAHRSARTAAQEVQGVFGSLWGIFIGVWSKNGGSLDPNGVRSSQPAPVNSSVTCENGGSIDPFGRCASGH